MQIIITSFCWFIHTCFNVSIQLLTKYCPINKSEYFIYGLINSVFLFYLQVSCSSSRTLILTDKGYCWQYTSSNGSLKKLSKFTQVETDGSLSDEENELILKHSKSGHGELSSLNNELNQKIIKICCGEVINVAVTASGTYSQILLLNYSE